MDVAEYHKMHAFEREYWWFQGRRRVILTLLSQVIPQLNLVKPVIVDVGCGTGLLLDDLQQKGLAVGLDFSPIALTYCQQRHLQNLGRADVAQIPIKSGSVDLVTALDLVEHISDDTNLMQEIHRILKPGGVAIMSVPAHKRLWSGHDIALHHFRRYEKNEFYTLVKSAGLSPVKYTYSIAVAYFPAVVFRSFKKFLHRSGEPHTDEFPLPRPINTLLRRIVGLEARWLKRRNLPFGLSLLCVAEKPR